MHLDGPGPRDADPQGPRTPVADIFVACVVLLQATAAGFIGFGGVGRVWETMLVGGGCLTAYLLGWSRGRWGTLVIPVLLLLAEAHYARVGHDDYWRNVYVAGTAAGATFAAAYLRRRVDEVASATGLVEERMGEALVFDDIDRRLGLDTRRRDTLAYELERARRHNHVLSVLIVRPDDFDEIVLRYGDDAAAEVLQTTASAVGRCLRGTDIPVREPPFDFAVILPETRREDARMVAERIRLSVNERRLEFGPGDVVQPSISVGVASFPHDATTNDQMTDAIHHALGVAVQAGGNRTMLYSVPEGSPAGWGIPRERLER